MIAFGRPSHSETIRDASSTEKGRRKARGFVLIRRKARIATQAKPTFSGSENVFSSQLRDC
jgi:hypothetical protein